MKIRYPRIETAPEKVTCSMKSTPNQDVLAQMFVILIGLRIFDVTTLEQWCRESCNRDDVTDDDQAGKKKQEKKGKIIKYTICV